MLKLTVQERSKKEKGGVLRKKGMLPAVFYGRKENSTPIAVPERDFMKVWKDAGHSSIIELLGVGEDKEALIHDVAVHPVSGAPLHVDFYVTEKGKTITVEVPLEFSGTAPAVKELGGTLVKVLHEVEIEVLPKHLPPHLTVDVSSLTDFEKQIHVSDIVVPESVKILTLPDEVIALVSEVKEEEETPAEVDLSAIEVEKKGKAEDASVPSAEAPKETE